ncbi:MAG: FtsX-like permease family protein [Anaerolineales bacterium]|nr:FtsX-like permease family protein [Anaerolineales bacterium]MCB8990409.1 FtsX-like permease family protein [Ardenticatenaceae bacterium]MCB9003423.1 FtsX-like permease family protein [Ardenticatenaceae bacterium]
MVATRWRKVLLDLWSHKFRTLLVVAAIAVGVFAVGLVSGAKSLLLRELDRGYQASQASSATLYTTPFTNELAERIARMPGVAAAEGRRRLTVKVQVGPNENDTRDLLITAVPDLTVMQLDKVHPITGAWPANMRSDDIFIEQLSLDFLQAASGDTLTIDLGDGTLKTLTIAGLVHDANVPNAQVPNRAFGYVSINLLDSLGLGDTYTELRYRAADATNLDAIYTLNNAIETQIERSGGTVFSTDTPTPGEHWAQDIIETLVMLFILFGVLIMVLSGFLVVNTITALMAQQIKQIGVMKLVGARRRQIMGMYFTMVAAYGLLALFVAVPLSIIAAQRIVLFATDLLNVQIVDKSIPASIMWQQVAGGLGIPLAAALWPVINGARITTHKALNSLGIDQASARQGFLERLFAQMQQVLPLQRPFIISLRNTIRKKGRLALTLATLIMGTALFIGVLSVRSSVQRTLDDFMRYHRYDISLAFSRPYRAAQVEPLVAQLPGVVAVESWLNSSVRRLYADDTTSESISLVAAPAESAFMAPTLEAGRWLQSGDADAIVVNTDFMDDQPDLALGDVVELEDNGRSHIWQIVGIVPTAANGPTVYVDYAAYTHATRDVGQATSLKVLTAQHDAASQEEMADLLTTRLENAGIRISNGRTTEGIRESNRYAFNIIVGFLVLMAVLLATVGSLGLTTTMSINILERIREIGVLRAIGASDNAVRLIVLGEGVTIGLLSWIFGSVLAIPLSQLLSRTVGMALLGIPLNYSFATGWTFLWLGIVIILAAIASLGPARSASKLTIREVLAYE